MELALTILVLSLALCVSALAALLVACHAEIRNVLKCKCHELIHRHCCGMFEALKGKDGPQ